jgi:hypothetical protein
MRTRHESDCDEHGIFSGRWEIDLTLKEHQKVEAGPEFALVLFGIQSVTKSLKNVARAFLGAHLPHQNHV